MFRDLAASRELAWRLFMRDLSARYRQSLLGYVWAFLPPLAATIPFVFLQITGLVYDRGHCHPVSGLRHDQYVVLAGLC